MGFGFFQDGKGNKSSGRLNQSLIVWTGLCLCLWGIILTFIKPDLIGTFLGAGGSLVLIGMGAKTLQNNTEAKNGEMK